MFLPQNYMFAMPKFWSEHLQHRFFPSNLVTAFLAASLSISYLDTSVFSCGSSHFLFIVGFGLVLQNNLCAANLNTINSTCHVKFVKSHIPFNQRQNTKHVLLASYWQCFITEEFDKTISKPANDEITNLECETCDKIFQPFHSHFL